MSKYIGLTIGPIYKTLQNAKKTRELWAGSYIFSYIMKKLVRRLKGRQFVIPYVDNNDPKFTDLLNGKMPVGIFHDRMIFKAEVGDFEQLKSLKDQVLEEIARGIAASIGKDQTIVENYIDCYFRLYFCEAEFSGDYKTVNEKINSYLDSLELQQGFIREEDANIIEVFLKKVNKSFLIEKAFKANFNRFKSIPEIATFSLNLKNKDSRKYGKIFDPYESKDRDEDPDYDIYKDIEDKFDIEPGRHHRYIAIVHADGDSMRKTISALADNGDFQRFSRALFEFDLEANKEIKNFGGETIFAGGDDLLFFAPVIGKDQKNIFDLLDGIDRIFHSRFQSMNSRPTISFGLSISYYKFPLYEALNISRDLLSDKAKDKNTDKNAIAFRVLKHSGQYFGAVIEKGTSEYCDFINLVQKRSPAGDNARFLTSVIYTLFSQDMVLRQIGADRTRLKNFFDNTFNEAIHKRNRDQLDHIQKLIWSVFNSARYMNDDERGKAIYSMLRFNKFIRE